jgi:hypothetical protein
VSVPDARIRSESGSDVGDVLTNNQLAEYVIWALLQPPAVDVDVDTIIVRCFGAMI